jgi:hypothetical protein
MQPSDTAYPRLKSSFNATELERWYTPAPEELVLCSTVTRIGYTRFGFLILLKTFQRLGYFVTTNEIPDAIIDHIAKTINQVPNRERLTTYDESRTRKNHIGFIRRHLDVRVFDDDARKLLSKTLANAALTKDDLADIINIGIETLVKYRFELPVFGVLLREAKSQRAATYQDLFSKVYDQLSDVDQAKLDTLFVVCTGKRTSTWNELKNDAQKSTLNGLRERLGNYEQLSALASNRQVLEDIPVMKRQQLALEGLSLNAADMMDMEPKKRYTVVLALIQRQLARVTDDLCDLFCKQMLKVQHLAEAELEEYLTANQDKTDEILRRFAQLDTVLQSDQPIEDQIARVKLLVSSRPDLCEFSRTHAEYGGKNECRFMWRYFKQRRTQFFRILATLNFMATSQDKSFERAITFLLANHHRHADWVRLDVKGVLSQSLSA